MVYSYHSTIVQEAVKVLKATDIDRPLTDEEKLAVIEAIRQGTTT